MHNIRARIVVAYLGGLSNESYKANRANGAQTPFIFSAKWKQVYSVSSARVQRPVGYFTTRSWHATFTAHSRAAQNLVPARSLELYLTDDTHPALLLCGPIRGEQIRVNANADGSLRRLFFDNFVAVEARRQSCLSFFRRSKRKHMKQRIKKNRRRYARWKTEERADGKRPFTSSSNNEEASRTDWPPATRSREPSESRVLSEGLVT